MIRCNVLHECGYLSTREVMVVNGAGWKRGKSRLITKNSMTQEGRLNSVHSVDQVINFVFAYFQNIPVWEI